MTGRDDATESQVRAARPDVSTWLAANAGSGKTRVLTDRVARLLLSGVEPQHILCLTYTKAAASEMQNRLFRRLGEWAMLEDAKLIRALRDLGEESTMGAGQLAHARTLFARAIETPGGLKIQTIHAFCSSLLRRFPLEAGVSPQFTEMEDRAAALLRAEIVEDFARGPERPLIEDLARYVSGNDFETLTAAIAGKRARFNRHLDRAALMQVFGLPTGYQETDLPGEVIIGGEADLIESACTVLEGQSKTMVDLAHLLRSINWTAPEPGDLRSLYAAFLYRKDDAFRPEAKFQSVPTQKAQKAMEGLLGPFQDLMQRVANARERELALRAYGKSVVLHDFAAVFLPEYERRKQLRGWLDFDDLILKARNLLNDPAVAAWVLYRLDGGIDHILVDEAQDTSPDQWDVIEKLAQEFTSGLGARSDAQRTIFVVGDKKQSIYSFQGADPDAFDRMQREFGVRLGNVGQKLVDQTLEYSFRSSPAILGVVDLVFEHQDNAGLRKESLHRAFKSDLPGRVDLWPVVEKVETQDDQPWTDPVDRPGARHHHVILAEQIAREISDLIETGATIPDAGAGEGQFVRRPVHAGDFLILVQRRSELFSEIIRACKAANLPIAGADRLKVGAELAVKDLAVLLRFLATPEDSLSLAAALKSPLFGWNEQMLFDLAHRREGPFLWQGLRDRAAEFPDTLEMLNDLRDNTDFLRPFDLIERILTRHDGRRRLLGRLGPEAEDGINALLSQALAYERSDVPSLTGFLVWMETDDLEIKRQMGSVGDMIRVMTVHGAKGLEAPIVILPDTGPRAAAKDNEIMISGDTPLWKVPADQMPQVLRDARDAARSKEEQERLRLLYVALTRAEKWLIVAAAGEVPEGESSWYQLVKDALDRSGAVPHEFSGGTGLRLEQGAWDGLDFESRDLSARHAVPLPGFLLSPAPPCDSPGTTVSPSDLGGAKALPGDLGQDEAAAKLRGSRIHRLLEHLPAIAEPEWEAAAERLLTGLQVGELKDVLSEAVGVLKSPGLAHVFDATALAEVTVTAPLGRRRMHGVIDRLIVTDGTVLAVDFKTNATVPRHPAECPEGLLRQMGAYVHGLSQIYPGQKIQSAILWTRTAELMLLPHDLVSGAISDCVTA